MRGVMFAYLFLCVFVDAAPAPRTRVKPKPIDYPYPGVYTVVAFSNLREPLRLNDDGSFYWGHCYEGYYYWYGTWYWEARTRTIRLGVWFSGICQSVRSVPCPGMIELSAGLTGRFRWDANSPDRLEDGNAHLVNVPFSMKRIEPDLK